MTDSIFSVLTTHGTLVNILYTLHIFSAPVSTLRFLAFRPHSNFFRQTSGFMIEFDDDDAELTTIDSLESEMCVLSS